LLFEPKGTLSVKAYQGEQICFGKALKFITNLLPDKNLNKIIIFGIGFDIYAGQRRQTVKDG
jgi:hypothetical protein